MPTGATTAQRTRALLGRPQSRVAALSAAVLLPALAVLVALPTRDLAFSETGPWVVVLIAIGFVISEPMVFHIEARNEAVSFSPTDLPLAIGMVMLSPLSLVAARIVGGAIGLLIWRRQPLFKLVLNLAAFTAETVVAVVVFRSLFQIGDAASPAMWLWLGVSLLVGLIVGGVTIATAISAFEGDFVTQVRKEFSHCYLYYGPGAFVGASAAIPLLVEPWLAIVFLVPAPLVWLVLRSHGVLMHQYTDLSHVFDFSSQVASSGQLQDIADIAVVQLAEQLRAGTVALTVWDHEHDPIRAHFGSRDIIDVLPTNGDDRAWRAVIAAADPVTVEPAGMDTLATRLHGAGLDRAVAVALRGDDGPIGVLVAGDRQGVEDDFTADDVARLGRITEQLALALRKAQLHVQIQFDATHDRLTRLPNRPFFEAFVEQIIASSSGHIGAILMLDLDRFKEVNDTLGHHAGDQLLRQVADRVRDQLADGDVAARFGGDEFAVFVPTAGEAEASLLAEQISTVLEQPFDLGDSTVAIAASIGIAIAPDHGNDPDTLLRRADVAMYDAKRRHNRSSLYRSSLDGNDSVRLAMLGEFRDALHDETLTVAFQPKTELRTGRVVGVEALARWHHPDHGDVSPEVFIPLAEQAGLIEDLTDQVLTTSLRAVADWRTRGHDVGVAVNLSPLSLVNEALPRMVARRLEDAKVPATMLTIEITEQSMIGDTPRALRIIDELHGIGVRISIDDFGTGHSSLTNLRHLPISELKIDRSFVTEMLVEDHDEVIVRSTIDLGHNLGMVVVAEGVETAEIQERLRALGCDQVQGYGICRPLPFDKLNRWFDSVSTKPADRRGPTLSTGR